MKVTANRGGDSPVSNISLTGTGRDLAAPEPALRLNNWRLNMAVSAALYNSIAIPLAIVAVILWLTFVRAPIVPVGDEWEMTEIVQKFDAGTLGLIDFWQFREYNEHRTAASRAISLLIIELTGWNRQAHMVVNLLITGVSAALLLRAAFWTVSARALQIALTVSILVLFFSLTRFANWFLPYTDKIPTILGISICAYALAAPRVGSLRFVLAIAGAMIASLSSSGGLLAWFVFAPSVLLVSWPALAIWAMIGIGVIIPYLDGMRSGSLELAQGREGTIFLPPLEAIGYTLAFLGAPIGYPGRPPSQLFGIFGLVLLAANIMFLWRSRVQTTREQRLLAVWTGLAGFALLTAAAVMVGRGAAFGFSSSTTSRFIGFSSFLWIAVVVLALKSIGEVGNLDPKGSLPFAQTSRPLIVLNAIGLSAIVIGLTVGNVTGYKHALSFLAPPQRNQYCILAFDTAPDECLEVYPWNGKNIDLLRERSRYLAQQHLSIFQGAREFTGAPIIPRPAAAGGGFYRCSRIGSQSNRDPNFGIPNGVPQTVFADLCAEILAIEKPVKSGWNDNNYAFQGSCLVENWGAFGEIRTVANEQWCQVNSYRGGSLSALSLVSPNGQLTVHAFTDGTLDLFANGQSSST